MGKEKSLTGAFTIGPASEAELEAICEIAKVAWEPIHEAMVDMVGDEIHEAISRDWKSRKAEQMQRHFREHPGWILVVRKGVSIAGFVMYRVTQEQSLGTIENNAAHPSYQGQGIATAVYRHVVGIFRESGLRFASVRTGVGPGHAPARSAYERAGFDRRREDVTYYQHL